MRDNPVRCSGCKKNLLKVISESYDSAGFGYRFTVGRLCKNCKMFYINPDLKQYKRKISSIGSDHEKIQT